MEDLHVAIGFAGMVDVVSAVSAFAPIKAPTIVDRANTQSSPPRSAIRFRI